ncbi:MAG: LLM class flavin-dependent oxidoreductase [Candidatus Promineifilaceae bacterium]
MKIGVVIDHVEDSKTGIAPTYTELRERALAAETAGFDSIWLFDHLLFRSAESEHTEGIWECWTLLSALADATSRVELGTLVLCTTFRSPALLAKMAHTVDEVSNGRLILGVGAGWHKPEFDAFGYPFDHRAGRFEEALQIIAPLLKGETVNFSGKYYRVENCVVKPLGPRPEGIPLLVGAGRPRMLRLTARYADQWNTAWLGDPAGLPERLERIHKACDEVGRDAATLAITVGITASYPDLGEVDPFARNPLGGSAELVARAFQQYEEAGVSHLITQFTPTTLPALERLAEAVRLYKGG